MLRTSTAVLASLVLLVAAPAQAQVCKCIDIGDIKARILEANAAIAGYSAEMRKMMEQMLRTQEPIPYTPAPREVAGPHKGRPRSGDPQRQNFADADLGPLARRNRQSVPDRNQPASIGDRLHAGKREAA